MKKLLCFIAALAVTINIYAEGYQVNTLSARQLGMGHTGTALKLNSESIWFNPAATVFQKNKFDMSLGFTGIYSSATYSTINYTGEKLKAKSNNKISTPLFAYFNWKPMEDLSVGIGFTTPYGSAMKWQDNWAGAHLIQNINMSMYSIQPTVAYKFCDGHLSVGAGIMIDFGDFNLSRSMLKVGEETNNTIAGLLTLKGMGQYAPIIKGVGNNPLVSAKLSGNSKPRIGFNIGIMYDINESWNVALTYRSRVRMKVRSGNAELSFANENVKKVLDATGIIPKLDEGTFRAELPLPATVSLGSSFRPYSKWEFAIDIQWVGWSAYKNLNVSFNEKELQIQDINSVKNYKNTFMTRLGGSFFASEYFTLRAGMYVDESPVRSSHLNPETPSMTKVGYTCGFSIMPFKGRNISFDAAYGYVSTADPERTGSYPYANTLKGGAIEAFSGNYSLDAHIFSFGLNYKF